jgi:integrase
MEDNTTPGDDLQPSHAIEIAAVQPDGFYEEAETDHIKRHRRTWQQEMPRWMATLNPGRTQREYEKAVTYFFETPGVPAELEDLSFDLLLAYRGALALRATPHNDTSAKAMRSRWMRTQHDRLLPSHDRPSLSAGEDSTASSRQRSPRDTSREPLSPLSPATVNLRLTALRQFLVHCAQMGILPQLTLDQVRSALRRLRVERRRPYQVLAENEWDRFLVAAEFPVTNAARPVVTPTPEHEKAQRSPWGTPRAARSQRAQTTPPPVNDQRMPLVKSRAGLTGARTAQRDHALIALALATGLRSVELAGLDVGDLIREWHDGAEEWWLVLPDAKTKGQHGGRTLPLAPSLVRTLLDYVDSTGRHWDKGADRETPLFLSRGRFSRADTATTAAADHGGHPVYKRLSPQHIRCIVDRVETQWRAMHEDGASEGETSGESRRISPHALRHSTAIALLEGNQGTGRPPASVEHVRGWLGHMDIRTTQGYLDHLDARRHRRPFTLSPTRLAASDTPSDDRTDATES